MPQRLLKILLHAGFFVSGIATVIIGQFLPILATKFSLNDAQIGLLFPAQFAGSLIGTFLTNWFGKRQKFVAASAFGCLAMAVGVSFLNFNSFELVLLGFLINGVGIGLTLPSINMLILELNPTQITSALSILNFFWGVGAIISSPFVDFFSDKTDIFTPTIILSIALFIISTAIFFQPKDFEKKPGSNEITEDFSVPIWSNPVAWAIAAFNFVHVGFESGMGGWLKLYTERIAGGEVKSAFPPILLFFVFFVVGRGVAPVFFRFLNENRMLILSLLTILTGMIVLLFAKDVLILSVGASITGFGTSSIFPTNVSRFNKFFGETASRRATPLFICGTLGAFSTTWLIGFLSDKFANLHAGMLTLLVSVLVLILLQIGLNVCGGRKLSTDEHR